MYIIFYCRRIRPAQWLYKPETKIIPTENEVLSPILLSVSIFMRSSEGRKPLNNHNHNNNNSNNNKDYDNNDNNHNNNASITSAV